MSDTETTTQSEVQEQERQYTPEELKTMRDNMVKFYKEETGFLQVQAKYETLLADIEEARLRRMVAANKMAYMYAQAEHAAEQAALQEQEQASAPTQSTSTPVTEGQPRVRKLKQD